MIVKEFVGDLFDAAKYGINRGSTLTYDTNNSGAAMAAMSSFASGLRTVGDASYSDEDRKSAVKK